MDAHYSIELPHAFVVGPDAVKKLVALLNERIGGVAITVDCSDGITRDFTSVRELLAYENPKAKEIRRIRLRAHSDDYSKNASIDLSGIRWRGISLDFNAREDVVSRLRSSTLDLIAGCGLGTVRSIASTLFLLDSWHICRCGFFLSDSLR